MPTFELAPQVLRLRGNHHETTANPLFLDRGCHKVREVQLKKHQSGFPFLGVATLVSLPCAPVGYDRHARFGVEAHQGTFLVPLVPGDIPNQLDRFEKLLFGEELLWPGRGQEKPSLQAVTRADPLEIHGVGTTVVWAEHEHRQNRNPPFLGLKEGAPSVEDHPGRD